METTAAPLNSVAGGAHSLPCPSRTVLDIIGNKWVCLIVESLRPGARRFGELRRNLDGITQKVLSQTLRELERNGLVHREVQHCTPPRVEYSLTGLGHGLADVMDPIHVWAEGNILDIHLAREHFARTQERASVSA